MHIHIVKPGDCVWTLSRYFGVPSQAIVEGNRIIHPDRLVVGQTLAKFNLVKDFGLRGFYYWVLGNEFPQNWLLVQDNFNVRKRL